MTRLKAIAFYVPVAAYLHPPSRYSIKAKSKLTASLIKSCIPLYVFIIISLLVLTKYIDSKLSNFDNPRFVNRKIFHVNDKTEMICLSRYNKPLIAPFFHYTFSESQVQQMK